MRLEISALQSLPEIKAGDDLRLLISQSASLENRTLGKSVILVIAQKVISKSEGAIEDLRNVQPGPLARSWAETWNKDPRLIEVILSQAKRVVKMDRGIIIAETHHGLICANAGVDQSNVQSSDYVTILPKDPDASARRLWKAIGCGAVVITDTFGRPWREGLVDVAIGIAGLDALNDCRGTADRYGRKLGGTILAVGDQLAAAAGLLMSKSAGCPVVLIDGFEWPSTEGSSKPLIRKPEQDLFR